MKNGIIVVLLALASMFAGWALYQSTQTPDKVAAKQQGGAQAKPIQANSVINQQRAAFSLPDLEDKLRHVKEWDGKVILLNFWATWCPPCRREIPAFIELQEQYGAQGFQVLGVAIDERDAVEDYADGLGANYPILIGDSKTMNISAAYGNRFGQLPYSLIIDRQGTIRFVGKGELSFADVEKQIKPLL